MAHEVTNVGHDRNALATMAKQSSVAMGEKDLTALLRVFIDYALPDGPISQWLRRLFDHFYAHWCTRRMADDAAKYFR